MVAVKRRCLVSMLTVMSTQAAIEGSCAGAASGTIADDACVVDDSCLLQKTMAAVGTADLDDEDAPPSSGLGFLAHSEANPPVLAGAPPPQVLPNRRDPFFGDEDADLFKAPVSSYATNLIGTSADVALDSQKQQAEQHAQFLAEEQEQWEAEQEAEQQSQLQAEKDAEQQAKQRAEQIALLTMQQQASNEGPSDAKQRMEQLAQLTLRQHANDALNKQYLKTPLAAQPMLFSDEGTAEERMEQLAQLTLRQHANDALNKQYLKTPLAAQPMLFSDGTAEEAASQGKQDLQTTSVQRNRFSDGTAEEALVQARMFFEEQGNLGGRVDASLKPVAVTDEKLLPRISAETFNERILPPPVSAMQQPQRLSFAQTSSGLVSKAASELLKGHSMSGQLHQQTGEEGELYGTFVDPNLMRLAFPQKSEAQLYDERRIYQAQDQVAHVQQDTEEEFGKLKAAVYHSADETVLREQEAAGLETSLRRAELLTDANQVRAQFAHDSRLEAQSQSSLERAAHLGAEGVQQERDLRGAAESRTQMEEDARIAAGGRAFADETVSVQHAQEEADRVRAIERETLGTMTQDAISSGGAVADVIGSNQNFNDALDDASLEAARRRADLEHWFGVASSVAEGVPSTQLEASIPEVSEVQPSTEQEIWGRTITPTIIREDGTDAGLYMNQPQNGGAVPMTQFRMPEAPQMAPMSSPITIPANYASVTPIMVPAEGTNTASLSEVSTAKERMEQLAQLTLRQEHSPKLALLSTGSTLEEVADSSPAACQPGNTVWPACAASASTHGPEHSACTPQCTWQCDTPACDEVCEPQCQPPRCETRCSGLDTSACVMECDEPHCAVACNGNQCPSGGCASCQASCSEPMCKLRCPNAQPCRNVCEEPSCEWHCRAPEECPAPQCHMVCETPRDCMGNTYQQLPPLAPGEVSVQSFAAPPALPGTAGANMAPTPPTVQVPVMSGGGDSSEFQRHTVVTMPRVGR